ncbi:MFS general substrate transporter [Cristinia sonorae]|uniref:MFS general substrate transporter n=1 Tax=Cristinia sonorae TaxID=1940300 RepID=A0A8K0URC7_9AGAR|nr:MFS general substrate transporter [Cristinia sonorae]
MTNPSSTVTVSEHGRLDLVAFSQDDSDDPRNWSKAKKIWVFAVTCLLSFIAVFGSSVYAPGEEQIIERYGVNQDVASTGLTTYVLGFGFGPLLWGPLSEMYGKRIIFLISWAFMTVSMIPSAFVDNIIVILVFRFFTGLAAACPLSNGSSVSADIFRDDMFSLARASSIFAFCSLSGPCFGTLVGFFVAAHSGKTLWVLRLHFFMSIAAIPFLFIFPETYGPRILEQRAKRLRAEGKTNARAATEVHTKSTVQLVQGHIIRPFAMFLREPVLQGVTLWISLAYGIIYFFFEMYPVVFIEHIVDYRPCDLPIDGHFYQHGIEFQLCGLMFLPVAFGMLLAVASYPQLLRISQKIYIPGIECKDIPTQPQENNLKVVVFAVILMPTSLFWFAWTSGHEVSWVSAALSGIPFGFSTVIIFFTFTAYLLQTYGVYATSAQSANTFVRSMVAAVFPIAAHSVIRNLGTKWGASTFGFISLGMIPIPLIFIRYGARFREQSHFASAARRMEDQMQTQGDSSTIMGIDMEKHDHVEAQSRG